MTDGAAPRLAIDNAAVVPRAIEPPAPAPIYADTGLPRHLTRRFAETLPIALCGMAEDRGCESAIRWGIGGPLWLYRDVSGLPRTLDLAGHEAQGIGSLFAGDDWLLARLWPPSRAKSAARRSFDVSAAAESLIVHQGRVGSVRGDGFAPIAESAEVQRAHIAIGRLVRRLLWRRIDPYQVLDLARGWNASRGHGALSDEIVLQIVDAACARELSAEAWRRAG